MMLCAFDASAVAAIAASVTVAGGGLGWLATVTFALGRYAQRLTTNDKTTDQLSQAIADIRTELKVMNKLSEKIAVLESQNSPWHKITKKEDSGERFGA